MLSRCANSQCLKPFLRLGEGKLFLVESEGAIDSEEMPIPFSAHTRRARRRVERYWLCDQCAKSFTLIHDPQQGITIVPRPIAIRAESPAANEASETPGSA
jgi:hypothetical protein